jgi:hypothetical protein
VERTFRDATHFQGQIVLNIMKLKLTRIVSIVIPLCRSVCEQFNSACGQLLESVGEIYLYLFVTF